MDAVICGIDPGLAITGYAVIAGRPGTMHVLDAGVCRIDRALELPTRLARLRSDILSVLQEHSPAVVAVEQLYAHYEHPRTAILMGHARGVILSTAAELGLAVRSYAATRIKRYLTGHGRATKQQVQRSVERELGLSKLPEPADVADAIAIAMTCAADLLNPMTKKSNRSVTLTRSELGVAPSSRCLAVAQEHDNERSEKSTTSVHHSCDSKLPSLISTRAESSR